MKTHTIILGFCVLAFPVHADTTQLSFVGKVVYVPLEGGFYGITNHQGGKFFARNLPNLLKQEGLSVTLQATKSKNTMSLQMWGELIDLQSIAVTTCTRLPKTD